MKIGFFKIDTRSFSSKAPQHFWYLPALLLSGLMLGFWLDSRFELDMYRLGILPGSYLGLLGILTGPLVHGSASHLMSNALPVLLLGLAIRYFYYEKSLQIIAFIWLITGLIVWLFARHSYHIGASGIVYGFASFIFFSGIIRAKVQLLALSLLIAFVYGGMVWGMLPLENGISWESHMSGGFSGLAVAFFYRGTVPYESRVFIEDEEEDEQVIKLIVDDADESTKIFKESSCSKEGINEIKYTFTAKTNNEK